MQGTLFTVDDDEFDELADRFESRYSLDPQMDSGDIADRLIGFGDLPPSFPYLDFASRYHWTRANEAVAGAYGTKPGDDMRIAEREYKRWEGEMSRLARSISLSKDERTSAMYIMQYVECMKQAHLWRICFENITGRPTAALHTGVKKRVSFAMIEHVKKLPPKAFVPTFPEFEVPAERPPAEKPPPPAAEKPPVRPAAAAAEEVPPELIAFKRWLEEIETAQRGEPGRKKSFKEEEAEELRRKKEIAGKGPLDLYEEHVARTRAEEREKYIAEQRKKREKR